MSENKNTSHVTTDAMTEEQKTDLEKTNNNAETTKENGRKRATSFEDADRHSLLRHKDVLGKESEEGNVEYKWKLVNISPERFEHLVSQLKYRLTEGQGEAIYEIGIDDDGFPKGLLDDEFDESIATLTRMAAELQADVTIVCEKVLKEKEPRRRVGEALVRRYGEDEYLDLRLAVCGNVDSGKSTLIGVLTTGKLDNGRGAARANVFQHKHEIDSGRTSSISQQIIGFDSKGNLVNDTLLSNTWQNIIEKSSKVCTFIDLAGHEKYLKTTVFGMTGNIPDYACLLVGANMGVTRMTKEHLGLCLALKIPVFVVVTKVDMSPPNVLKQTIEDINKILKLPGVRKIPYQVKSEDDIISCTKNMVSDRVTPIFQISSVSGHHLDLFKKFLNLLPARRDWEALMDCSAEFLIDQTFHVTGVGTVVSGIVTSGAVSTGDSLWLGPDGNGQFKQVQIKSVHVKRCNVRRAVAGQAASFALKKEKRSNIRKGMVMIDSTTKPQAVWEFEAEVLILYHSTTIQTNYQPMVHCMTVRQCAKIILTEEAESLRTGDKARVKFRFMFRPEYIKEGARIIFREGRTKGLGVVSKVFPVEH